MSANERAIWIEGLSMFSSLLHVLLFAVFVFGCRRKSRTPKHAASVPITPVPPTPAHKAVPPPNVPVSKPKVDDSTLKEVESLKQEKNSDH
ncbi:hypothetical protein M3Y94_00198600 [Aphelenchoides besseyi]|nr:hypothetical protein M3Y94_00198600 [Aphelenchoides besseyi]